MSRLWTHRNRIAFYGPQADGRWDSGNHTPIWRKLSYAVGDKHAYRLCFIISIYCKLTGLKPERLHNQPRKS